MNSSAIAERQAKAIQAISEHTARLGGQLVQPTVRASGPAAKYVLMLEAIAQALAGINNAQPPSAVAPDSVQVEDEPQEVAKPRPAKRKGNL